MKRIILPLLILFALVSCNQARFSGQISGVAQDSLVLEKLNVNYAEPVDTLVTDEAGKFACRITFDSSNPEFFYLNYHGRRLATLLLKKGDKVYFESDSLGNGVLSGSEESSRMMESEKEYAKINARCSYLATRLEGLPQNTRHAASLRREVSENYLKLYRSSVRYVLENPRSMTSVPVLFRKLGEMPVFNQPMDALHFRNLADSLSTIYPTSPYVRALQKEAQRREKGLSLVNKIDSVAVVGFPEIELPNIHSQKVKLSEVDAKVILLHFWTCKDGAQKLCNQDVLKPLYEKYHAKGLEIYQVALDVDKFDWAQVVKAQNMPWLNVCDIRGGSSSYLSLYNVSALPAQYLIVDGALTAEQPSSPESLKQLLSKLLK
jgi:hypothetical protein